MKRGPLTIEGRHGWPLPDRAYDPCGIRPNGPLGFLPWAVIESGPDWYVGLYSCDRGHAWTCGYGAVGDLAELVPFTVSPLPLVPLDYLRSAFGIVAPRLAVIDWPEANR